MRTKYFLTMTLILAFQLNATAKADPLDADQKRRMMLLTSTFENSFPENTEPNFAYDYIENLNDGRGFTAGRVGFCTGTHDLLQVVELYNVMAPHNRLTPFLPRLQEVSLQSSDSVAGLEELPLAWKAAAMDPLFRSAQDQIVDKIYYLPAVAVSEGLGLKLPFSFAVIYDTAVMHGFDEGDDSLKALIKRTETGLCPNLTTDMATCTPKNGWDEKICMDAFLMNRKATLLHPSSQASTAEWSQNAVRADILKDMLDSGRFDQLDQPLKLDNYYFKGEIK